LIEILGEGGFGTVYLGRSEADERLVALKVLNLNVANEPDRQARLRDEGRILSMLDHPAIVEVDHLGFLEGRWTLVMEYLEGANVSEVLTRGSIPMRVSVEIVKQVALALEYAFERLGPDGQHLRLIHRDIKPSNVQITVDGVVKVMDFGVARADFSDREADTGVHVLGSMHYMPPERFEGQSGPASDIYSLGVLLFEILLGEMLGRSALSLNKHQVWLGRAEKRLKKVIGAEKAELSRLVLGMLAYETDARPTATAVVSQCDQLLQGCLSHGVTLKAWVTDFPLNEVRVAGRKLSGEPGWPDAFEENHWVVDHETTDAIFGLTDDDHALGDADDTLSLVFSGGEESSEDTWTLTLGDDREIEDDITEIDPPQSEALNPRSDALPPNGAADPSNSMDRAYGLHASPLHTDPGDQEGPFFDADTLQRDLRAAHKEKRNENRSPASSWPIGLGCFFVAALVALATVLVGGTVLWALL